MANNWKKRLPELHERLQGGRYRAMPSKRIWIPKPDGRKRPIGIAVLEDKVVQQAVVTVLNRIYEEDFLGFSYGFRPGRHPHRALDAVWVGDYPAKDKLGARCGYPGIFSIILTMVG